MEENVQNFGGVLKNYVSVNKILEAKRFLQFIHNSFENENLSPSTRGITLHFV